MQKRNFKRILIVRLSSLGDVIQTLPVPTVVREAYPEAEIGWAIDRELAPAIAGHRDLHHVHACDRTRWGRNLRNRAEWRRTLGEAREFIDEIRSVGYDCALDVQGLLKSAVIPFFARIPTRIGFAHGRELSHFFYTEHYLSNVEYFDHGRMHVDHMMALTEAIGCRADGYQVRLPPVDAESRASVGRLMQFDRSHPLVAIAPATQWSSKQWPFEHWLSLLRLVLSDTEANVLLVGTDADRPTIARLNDSIDDAGRRRILNLAGQTSITELYALFEKVDAMVAADTAPLHIAGAAGCNLVGLFGATPTQRTGPLGNGSIVPMTAQPALACQPCQQRTCRFGTTECMRNLSPHAVFKALTDALRSPHAAASESDHVLREV